MPGALAVSLLVHVEHLNLHCSSDISQHMARDRGKGPAGGAAKWVWEGCSLRWRTPMSWGQPALTVAMDLYGVDLQPRPAVYDSVQFSSSVVSNSLQFHGLQHTRLPCPLPTPRAYSSSHPWVRDAIQLSHSLLSPSPPAFNLSQHQGLSQWVSSSHQVTKILEFQPQHQSFQWIFKTDFL